MRKLAVVGCDGTVTNTGWKNSVIHRIENHVVTSATVEHMHFNELPFSHIFQHTDGQTAGPKSFSGPIKQQLTCYENLPVVDYEPIDCSIPDIDNHLGALSRRLGKSGPGPLFHSRWLLWPTESLGCI
ncbi:hypothetical protein AVEN_239988-1 [Araneus ventricosus]|uniref:Uncharacterized protein n=1 Tax=Araneus ventricosus TaxID=182803 RepID=A0A4Y2JSI7_ARAVE|nr:hypothetical protein AVEN_239988-1 [Araneus ventricosus]